MLGREAQVDAVNLHLRAQALSQENSNIFQQPVLHTGTVEHEIGNQQKRKDGAYGNEDEF